MCWGQAVADVRGETSQDAWDDRATALAEKGKVDEKAKTSYLEASFADALAIYLLSLSVDFELLGVAGAGVPFAGSARRWRRDCAWWRSCFLRTPGMSLRSGTGGGRRRCPRSGADGVAELQASTWSGVSVGGVRDAVRER